MHPKVIFIDGFNTVGKDYFIKQLQEQLPHKTIVTDPRVWLPQFQQNKRYWNFIFRDPEENEAIFNAHIKHLRRIAELLREPVSRDAVILTNRSFVTAMNYNFIPHKYAGLTIGGDDEYRKKVLEQYRGMIEFGLGGVPTLMVNLSRFHNLHYAAPRSYSVDELRKRMRARQPTLQMDEHYLYYLVDSYQTPAPQVKQLYTHWENAVSSDAQAIVKKYF